MARITAGPKYRLYKTEGVDLGLKGKRSLTKGPAPEKLNIAPGANGARRNRRGSDYSVQLRAKQKAKRMYIVAEKQFKNYFLKAKTLKGQVGDNLLLFLEHRLDNVVYKSGLSLSKDHSRQLVSHMHVMINGKVLNVPSYQVKTGDVVTIATPIAQKDPSQLRHTDDPNFTAPEWLELDKKSSSVKIVGSPDLTLVKQQIDVNLIVEYYSR